MIGAIIGDIVGSRYEFNNIREKNFIINKEKSFITDDSIMTLAVCDWYLNTDKTKESATKKLKLWGRKYPDCSYGSSFRYWLFSADSRPYYSYGNGSAMRISSLPYLVKTKQELEEAVINATSITHDHPEGIKGALVVANCIYMALNGCSKDEIKVYAIEQYPIIKTFNYEHLRQTYSFNETCQNTVPQAIFCFLISKDFEDCLRTTISIGGDCDTSACISCSIAEAYYKDIPLYLKELAKSKFKTDSNKIYKQFENEKHLVL